MQFDLTLEVIRDYNGFMAAPPRIPHGNTLRYVVIDQKTAAAIRAYCREHNITWSAFGQRALRLLAVQLGIVDPRE